MREKENMRLKAFILITAFLLLFSSGVIGAEESYEVMRVGVNTVKIDGIIEETEWADGVKISLRRENVSTWAGFDDEENILPLDAYVLWCTDGIYIAGDITDGNVTTRHNDCFEFAFNPGGLIPASDPLQGMFFMFWLGESDSENGGEISCTRHNMSYETRSGVAAELVRARYTFTENGWRMEGFIPWEYICPEERAVVSGRWGETKTGVLNTFDPFAEDAYLTATVCYLNGDGQGEEGQYLAVYRTCTDLNGENFNTDSYNIRLTLSQRSVVDNPDGQTTDTVGEAATAASADTADTDTGSISDTGMGRGVKTALICAAALILAVIITAVAFLLSSKKRKR